MFQKVFSTWRVWGHGLLLAVLGALATALTGQSIPGVTEAHMLVMVALSAGIAYLIKNVLTGTIPNGSSLFSLNLTDIAFMVLQFVMTGILTAVLAILATWHFPTLAGLEAIAWTAVTNAVVYLAKNFVTNSQGQLASEPTK